MPPLPEVSLRRFWLPSGHGHSVDAGGFLHDPETAFRRARLAKVDALSEDALRHRRSLVLLGEPGMGKSTFLAQAKPLLPSECQAQTVHVDLAEFGSEDRLVRSVFESEVVEHWRSNRGELCLTLDGFDDAQTRIPQLGLLVARVLSRWPLERLWLRIACRTSDWPLTLANELPKLTPDINVVELLPLRRRDVAAIAVEEQVDPKVFLAAVEARRVEALAARPLTLSFLLRTFASHGRLPERAGDLYRENLLAMCDEQNPARRQAAPRTVAAGDLYAVVRRVAAASVFRGAPAVWLGPLPCPAGEDLLAVDDLAGGSEPEAFGDVTPPLVREATRTPLFAGPGEGRRGWAHTTFQDFLAAEWLLANHLPEYQIRSLLLASDGGVRPQLRRVAAWTLALSPDQLGWLTEEDPQSFVDQVDIPAADLRKLLVDRLIMAAEVGKILNPLYSSYSGLAHVGLADQLKPVLAKPGPARWLAFRLASDCEVYECDPAMAAVALDPHAPIDDRIAAGWALSYRKNRSSILLPLVLDESLRPDDNHDELLGVGLLASWPLALSTAQALDTLTRSDGRRHGSAYRSFVDELTRALTIDDLAAAAAWLLKTNETEFDSELAKVRTACLKLCADHLDNPDAAAAAVAVSRWQLLQHDRVLTDNQTFPEQTRRRLAILVARGIDADQDPDLMASIVDATGRALLTADDFLWLLGHVDIVAPEDLAAVYGLLPHLVDPTRVDHADAVLSIEESSPLRSVFDHWLGSCVLADPHVVEVRALWQRMRERQVLRENPRDDIEEDIVACLNRFEDGDPNGYWIATRSVCVRPGTNRYWAEHQPDLTAHPRWDRLSSAVRDRLVDLAPRYLAEGKCAPERWLGQGIRLFAAEAGYRALLLLLKHTPSVLSTLDATVWQEWAPIIIAWSTATDGARAEDKVTLLRHAAPYARKQLSAALLAVIDEASRADDHRQIQVEADSLWDEHLQNELTDRLAGQLSGHIRDELATALLRNSPDAAESLLTSWLDEGTDRAHCAASHLLNQPGGHAWPLIYSWMQANPESAKDLFLTYAHNQNGIRLELPSEATADLYLWLWDQFPPDEDPREDEAHWVTPRESVGNLRDRTLDRLRQTGTQEALTAVRRIVSAHPEASWLNRVYEGARTAHRQATWKPTFPSELRLLAEHSRRRLVHTDTDLLDAVIAALESIQERLVGETPESHLLWDTATMRPKTEDEVSDYLQNRLNDALAHNHVVVNREVQVRRKRPSGIGERADLRIDAFAPGNEAITVVIEVKTAWSDEVTTAIPKQLVGRYMHDIGTPVGVLVVIWADLESWTAPSNARDRASSLEKDSLHKHLTAQASQQSAHGNDVRIFDLDIAYRRTGNTASQIER